MTRLHQAEAAPRPIHQRPSGRPLIRMQWRNLLFMHWPVPAHDLRPLIPDSLEIEEYDGKAWVGLIPFTMRDVMYDRVPCGRFVSDLPALSAFHECKVRTYVHPRGRPDLPGVWFFSLDAASRAAVWVARRFFHLQYFRSSITLDRRNDLIRYTVKRREKPNTAMQCEWRVGEVMAQTQPGDLAHFLTERYMLFSSSPSGALHQCRIWHNPWPLREAKLISFEDQLVRAAGIDCDLTDQPIVYHADVIDTHAWPLEAVEQ